MRKNLGDLRFSTEFSDTTPRAQCIKEKIWKSKTQLELKFLFVKDTCERPYTV
jgi:hypothetical protein